MHKFAFNIKYREVGSKCVCVGGGDWERAHALSCCKGVVEDPSCLMLSGGRRAGGMLLLKVLIFRCSDVHSETLEGHLSSFSIIVTLLVE